MKKYRPFIIGLILGGALLLGALYLLGGRVLLPSKNEYYTGLDKAYGKYYEIIKIIDEEALADYDPEEITDEVLKKMVAGLDDKYAEYYTADEYANFIKRYAKSYVGVGVSIGDKDGRVYVGDVVEDSPAEEAGIKVGDIITAVDGKAVKSSDDAVNRMAGENGTEVSIAVDRNGKSIDFTMNRGKVVSKSVEYKELDKENKIGYICISSFKAGTAKEFKLAVKDLKNAGYDKVIIDLRNNGGGSTVEAYQIADSLLPECDILKEVDNKGKEVVQKSDAITLGIEYVVLVNENTASASEMVCAAIKDNEGGKIIGCTTFGKGVTQKTTQFDDGSALKITIQEFFRPGGKPINEVGIEPDIEVENPEGEEIIELAIKELC